MPHAQTGEMSCIQRHHFGAVIAHIAPGLVIASAFACTRDTSAIDVMGRLKELYESNWKRINRYFPRTKLI